MKNSIIDVASMDPAGVSEMKKFLYQHAKTGDLLRVNVSFGEDHDSSKKFVTEAVFLEDGADIPTLDTNVFLPFEGIPDAKLEANQTLTISSSKFEFVDDKVVVDEVEVGFGSPFMVGGRRVVLAKGSIVLLLEDSLVRVFPEEGVQSEIVVNDGTLAVGDIMTTGVFQLEEKSDNSDTSIAPYVFFHDASTDQRTCVSKKTHTADFMLTAGSSLLDLAYLDGSLENVLSLDSSSVSIRSISGLGEESVATIDFDGLSFSSNESAVILGSLSLGSLFRMKYDETSDTIQIQHLDQSSGEYYTKREFGR
ncbi:unnamed protein product [Sphacelaria rigidula]